MNSKRLSTILIFVLVFFAGAFAIYNFGVYTGERRVMGTPPLCIIDDSKNKPENIDFSIFWEGWRQLENNYLDVKKIDYKKMVYGALRGMVASIGDPYTSFFNPSEAKDFNDELAGKYEGVGMIIGSKDGQITVVSPFKDSPAEKAGIKAGDKIVKIDDKYTADLVVDEAAKLIRGPRDSEVELLLDRKGWSEPKSFKIKRQLIKIPTLEWEAKDGGIAVIKIYQFNEILPSEFKGAATEIINSSAKKIIIDLRNNPGGYLEVAQEIAGWFIKKGEVVVWQDRGRREEKIAYSSAGPAVFHDYPTVVLINEGSASASEILAGALRDRNGCKLIGQKSFGKGSVQEQIHLSDDSSLKVTIAKWLTPNGNLIDGNGLEPDIQVVPEENDSKDKTETRDIQLEKAIEFLNNLK